MQPRLAGRAPAYVEIAWRNAAHWLDRGLAGVGPPRRPRRYGGGPYGTSKRYALFTAFYAVVLAAWLAGRMFRAVSGRPAPARRPTGTRTAGLDTVRDLDVLPADQCAAICRRVHDLRSFWIRRQPGEFFTLGRASYMDCHDSVQRLDYLSDAHRLNAVLLGQFQPVYDALIAALERALAAPCQLTDRFAVPGFHVWLAGGIPRHGFDVGSVHFDLQYASVGLARPGWPTASDVLSFTLPLRLPRAGGGLNVWDLSYAEARDADLWHFRGLSRVPYSVGRLVLHTGHELHQIAPVPHVANDDERICLQGHGVREGGVWRLYW